MVVDHLQTKDLQHSKNFVESPQNSCFDLHLLTYPSFIHKFISVFYLVIFRHNSPLIQQTNRLYRGNLHKARGIHAVHRITIPM